MLYFSHSLLICTLLFLLISSVALNQSGAAVTRCVWVKYPDIKKRSRPQKFSATMSRRAPSSLLAVLCLSCSSSSGCRGGSIPTPWHVSVRSCAVMSRSSLCLIEGRPPQAQLRAFSMVYCLPQTQFDGRCGGRHPYLRLRASLKSPLCRAKPCSAIGRDESQLDAPFSLEASRALCWLWGILLNKSLAHVVSCCLLAW